MKAYKPELIVNNDPKGAKYNRYSLRYGGKSATLQPNQFAILHCVLKNRLSIENVIATRALLANPRNKDLTLTANALHVHLTRLRQKLAAELPELTLTRARFAAIELAPTALQPTPLTGSLTDPAMTAGEAPPATGAAVYIDKMGRRRLFIDGQNIRPRETKLRQDEHASAGHVAIMSMFIFGEPVNRHSPQFLARYKELTGLSPSQNSLKSHMTQLRQGLNRVGYTISRAPTRSGIFLPHTHQLIKLKP